MSKTYIDREAALERIDSIWDCNDMVFRPNDHCCNVPADCKGCKWAETKDAIRRIIVNTPAADVEEVRHGQWKSRKNWSRCVCSVCSYESGNEYNYCPNCGAKMTDGEA